MTRIRVLASEVELAFADLQTAVKRQDESTARARIGEIEKRQEHLELLEAERDEFLEMRANLLALGDETELSRRE